MLVHSSGKVASHISFQELVTKSLKKHFTKTQLPKSLEGEWKFLRKPPPEKSDKSKKHSHKKKKALNVLATKEYGHHILKCSTQFFFLFGKVLVSFNRTVWHQSV